MKHKLWINHLLGAVFAFILSVSVVGSLATGFDLPITSMGSLILCCGVLSLLCALMCCLKYGGSLILCLSLLTVVYLWNHSPVWDQIQTLLLNITTRYHRAYNWPILGADAAKEVDLALMLCSGWTAASVSFCVCRRKPIVTALPSAILPLVLCMIITSTVPDELYLYPLILGVALLLLTDWVRRHHPVQGITLTLRMAIPVAAALAALFWLNPQDRYVNNAKQMQEDAIAWFQQFQTTAEEVTGGIVSEAAISQQVNLRSLGPRSRLSFSVMRVTAPMDGILYLRGQDFDIYTGEGWTASLDRNETFTPGIGSAGELTIMTYSARSVLYIPYYSTESIQLSDGRVDNNEDLTSYRYEIALSPANGTASPDSRYTLLPEDTLLWAIDLTEEIIAGCTTQDEQVQAIRDFVRNSASYDLNTSRMSRGSEDFARWFLEESDTGYCVHFATAATVLLRAAGIPARYVEGYMVSCQADMEIVISNQSAHAWAEYYDFTSAAWRVLEATPPDENAEEETTVPAPTESVPTEPAETQPQATIPSQTEVTQTRPVPGPSEQIPQKVPITIPDWGKTLVRIILALAAIVLQGELRIAWKQKLWNQGKPNRMALTRWKLSRRLARVLKLPLPENLEMLAQKAKFSQHTLTHEELQQFDHFRRDALRMLAGKSRYRRWFLRWILAIG